MTSRSSRVNKSPYPMPPRRESVRMVVTRKYKGEPSRLSARVREILSRTRRAMEGR